jgi:hypothetical protein
MCHIDDMYKSYESGAGARKRDIRVNTEMRKFVREALALAVGEERTKELGDDTDLFAAGVDSLQAGRTRNVCQMSLELGGATLGQNGRSCWIH